VKIPTRAFAVSAVSAGFALAIALIPTAAMASDTPPPPGDSPAKLSQITVDPTGPNVSTLSFGQTGSKSAGVTPNATRINSGTLSATGTKIITPAGGSRAGLYDAFSSSVTVASTYTNLHGTSQGVWEGSSPLDASKISLVDSISTTGIGLSFNAGPIGVDFGHSSDSWTYSTSLANNYNLSHSYSGLQFGGAVLTVSESSQVTANFGSASYTQITN